MLLLAWLVFCLLCLLLSCFLLALVALLAFVDLLVFEFNYSVFVDCLLLAFCLLCLFFACFAWFVCFACSLPALLAWLAFLSLLALFSVSVCFARVSPVRFCVCLRCVVICRVSRFICRFSIL